MMKRGNTHAAGLKAAFILIFVFMLAMNRMTPMLVDDYRYCFSFVQNDERMVSLSQLIPSMSAHYRSMNGRLITHGMVQLLLMKCPPLVFDILNALMFTLMCVLVYRICRGKAGRRRAMPLLAALLCGIWIFVPAFGEVFMWLDGSCNYLWPLTIILLYLTPALEDTGKKKGIIFQILYIAAGFIVGGLSETVSMACMGAFTLMYIYRLSGKKSGKESGKESGSGLELWRILPVLTMLPTYIFMIKSPGTRNNKLGQNNIAGSFVNAAGQYWAQLKWLLMLWAVLAVLVYYLCRNTRIILRSFMWLFLSMGMNFMHAFTSAYPARSMMGAAVFALIAAGTLLGEMEGLKPPVISSCICAASLMWALFLFIPGVYDVYSTWRQTSHNEQLLNEVKGDAAAKVTLRNVHPSTPYAAAYSIKYLDTGNPKTWPNYSMAYYYGIDTVAGED